jgi:exopolyphosphatase/guanosine-5'-triphosphate,3'-diphosphate pyrophosphatase
MALAHEQPVNIAAVDLGSNSFHMVIGRLVDGEIRILDKVREHVALGAGVKPGGGLCEDAQERALACLERFGQRLEGIDKSRVRVVGTNAMRQARRIKKFRNKAEKAIGYRIEVISGAEEARLIYQGVAHAQFEDAPRLVADIGGGSTEIILGHGYRVSSVNSLFMGCVNFTARFFPEGHLTREKFRAAEIAARLELATIRNDLRKTGWELAIGASGTIKTVNEILKVYGLSDQGVTVAGMKSLRRSMITAGAVDRLELPPLRPGRQAVLPGGLAILRAIFRSLEIERMEVSSGALREGVLYDLVGRMRHEDVRDSTVAWMVDRYDVDQQQTDRVRECCQFLLAQIEDPPGGEDALRMLTWASTLHEIGLAVSHTGYHRHGAYLVSNTDMPGFSADSQAMLAALIRVHRRKIDAEQFEDVPESRQLEVRRLSLLFRLAVLLNRGRRTLTAPDIQVDSNWEKIALLFPGGWAEQHPLTSADLEQEKLHLGGIGVQLDIQEL